MPILPHPLHASDDALRTLGQRAVWLHFALSGRASAIHSPLDRELLTLVATRHAGITLDELSDLVRRFGVLRPPGNAPTVVRNRVAALQVQGYLTTRDHDGTVTVDINDADRARITRLGTASGSAR